MPRLGAAARPRARLHRRPAGGRARLLRLDRLVADAAALLSATPTAGSWPPRPAPAASLLANLLRRPLEAAVWVLCAAALPLVAYAIQQRAHGVFFQTSPRLQGVLGYPNAIGAYAALAAPAALWLASSPQRGRRVAGCATLSLLVLGLGLASSRGGLLAAVIGCAAFLAVSDRRTEIGAAVIAVLAVTVPVARWGARPALVQGARRAVHRARGLAPDALRRARRDRRGAARPARRGARAARRSGARRIFGFVVLGRADRRRLLAAAVRLSSSHDGPDRSAQLPLARSSRAAAPSAPPTTSRSSRPTCAAAGGARPGTPSATSRCAATAPTRSRRSTAWRVPTSSRPARSTPRRCTCSPDSGSWARIPAPDRAGRGRHVPGLGHAPARAGALRGAGARGGRRGLRAAQPDRLGVEADRADAARLPAAGARRLRRGQRGRASGRRSLAVVAAAVVRARRDPHRPARAEQQRTRPRRPARRAGPHRRGARRGRSRRRAQPHLGRRATAAREPAAGARPPRRCAPRRQPRHRAGAEGLAHLARAGRLPALLLERPGLAGEHRPRPRVRGHDTVFDGTDADVVAASDACGP